MARLFPDLMLNGSRQTAASQSHTPTHPGGKLVNRTEIVRLQFRVVIEDFLFCHARGEPTQHIPYRDAQPADTRLAGALAWLDHDAGSHASSISLSAAARSEEHTSELQS